MKKTVLILLNFMLFSGPIHADPLRVVDLLPGDLIFFMDSFGKTAEHVAVYAGVKRDGKPYIIHAVTHPHQAVVTTLLKPLEDTPLHVVRNRSLRLALSAHHRMKTWAEVMVPYDTEAAGLIMTLEDSMPFCHPSTGLEKYHRFAVEMGQKNFYRRIKYAARRMRPVMPAEESIKSTGRGFRCAEAAILAYQIEELSDAVADLSGSFSERVWVSDKYAHPDILKKLGATPEYLAYQASLNGRQTYTVEGRKVEVRNKAKTEDHQEFYPSFVAWNFNAYGSIEDYQATMDTCFSIDAKVSSAKVLYYHVMHDIEHWQTLGRLELPDHDIDAGARAAWREEVIRRRERAVEMSRMAAADLRDRASTADLEIDFRSLAWSSEVGDALRCATPRSPESRTGRITAIFATPPRAPKDRFEAEGRDEACAAACVKRLEFDAPQDADGQLVERAESGARAGTESLQVGDGTGDGGAAAASSTATATATATFETRKLKHPEASIHSGDD